MRSLCFPFFLAWCLALGGQDTLLLMPLPEVEFTVKRFVQDVQRGYATERIAARAIDRVQALTTADALTGLSGVYVQKSQFGGGSPVVRGFEANRVLLMVDGVRMNNAIFRGGHLQNAITVDPRALRSINVVYGPGALPYGTDAVGGVVHFRTRRVSFAAGAQETGWGGEIVVAGGTAARNFVPSIELTYRAGNFSSLTLVSSSFTSPLRAGARRPDRYADFGRRETFVDPTPAGDVLRNNPRPNRQIGTAYNQYNLLQKFRFRLAPRTVLTTNFQYSTSSDVPRYDALLERRDGQPRWARWDYGPQSRALVALDLEKTAAGSPLFEGLNLRLNHQFTAEDRLQRRFGDPLLENSLTDVHATTLALDLHRRFPALTLRYGGDLRHDRVRSAAFLTDTGDDARPSVPLEPRYPGGGSSLSSAGAYLDLERQLTDRWRLRAGARYNYQHLSARFTNEGPVEWPAAYLAGITNNQGALTGTAAVEYDRNDHHGRALLGQSFRAANVDDFGKFRERNGFISVPNPTLGPERGTTLEATYRRRWGPENRRRASLSMTLYHTWLEGVIVRSGGRLPDGSDFFVSRGDTLFVQTNVNAEGARVYGADLGLQLPLDRYWRIDATVHYLRGRRRQLAPDGNSLTLPQDHIPPPYGRLTLGYATPPGRKAHWTVDLTLRGQLAKAVDDYAVGNIAGTAASGYTLDRTGTADNLELTPLRPDGTLAGSYAWWTANLYVEYRRASWPVIRLKAENLLDHHYRTFASGVSAPGLDVGLSLSYAF